MQAWLQQQPQKTITTKAPDTEPPYAPGGIELSPENLALQQESISEYFHHIMASNRHQRDVFHWQLFSAKIIFGTVILLVIAGIYFAAVQFHHGLKRDKLPGQETEISASLKGIKVSSPVLGVIILTISLAFFYLYLVHVYPIEFVGG
jgi:heme/copper-type cytochrome/quinol oxidase subunit 2